MASQIYKNTTEEWSEKLLQCPYDPVHQIRPERFSIHLMKCRKALENHPTSPYYHKIKEFQICRWNQKHHIHKADIAQHEKDCSDNLNALKIRQFEKHEEEIKAQITKNITPINKKLPYGNDDSDSDDWNDDNVAAYDPTQKALQNNILPQGLTPAQRADYRSSRRQGDLPEFMKKETEMDPWNQPDSWAAQPPPMSHVKQPQRQSPKPVKQSAGAAGIQKNQNGKSKPPASRKSEVLKSLLSSEEMDMFSIPRKGNGSRNNKNAEKVEIFRENDDFTKKTDDIIEKEEEKPKQHDLTPISNGNTKKSSKQKVKDDQKRPEKFVKSTQPEKFEEPLTWTPPEIPEQKPVEDDEEMVVSTISTSKKSKKQNKKKSKKQVVVPNADPVPVMMPKTSADLNVPIVKNGEKSENKMKKQNGAQNQNGLSQSQNNHAIEQSSGTTSLKFLICMALIGIFVALFWMQKFIN